MSILRNMPSDIDKDAGIAGIDIWKFITVVFVGIILIVSCFISGLAIEKLIKSALIIIGLYVMFLFDGFTKLGQIVGFIKSSKKETAESLGAFSDIETISMNKRIKRVIAEIVPEANFGALDPNYQEQLASDFAVHTYEMTTREATVRYISYSSSEPLYPLNKKLEKLKGLDVHARVRENYERRISLHGHIADRAVKTNYVMCVDLPLNSETEWEDVLPFGEVIGEKLIKEMQVQQLLPIPRVDRGATN